MKKIYSIILVFVALFAIQSIANAQPYTEKNHIAYSKYPTGPVNGIYTIHLDTFVTGEVTVSTSNLPADVVLVLDVSGSMDDDYTSSQYVYTARESQGYSYNSFGNNTYYYRHTDGNYYPVTRRTNGGGMFSTTTYSLRVQINNYNYYLSGTQLVGNRPTNITSASTTIWTGVLYEREVVEGQTKLEALQAAVADFIDVIKENAEENDVDNQIAIVKFAMNSYYGSESSIAEGDHAQGNNNTGYNYTEVVKQFTSVKDNAQALKNAVNSLHAAGATAADYGMRKAELLLNDLIEKNPDRQSNKTVVLFTDGAPTYSNSFSTTVADNTISKAHTIKGIMAYHDPEKDEDVYTTVFTVGVFDNETDNIRNYMNYTSSNYPEAEAMDDEGSGSDQGYYQVVSDETDLSSIFRSIASQAGGSQATTVTAEAATTVDVVSQSFDLPDGASTNITVHFANCIGKDSDGYLVFDEENLIDNPEEGEDGHVTITIDESTQKVTASGFDYSGNWCGYDESISDYHGMKLMLEIPIEMADDAVGGNAVGTNGPESGIYVNGEPVLKFDIPHIDLPTNLHIKKEGIADGECATFLIYRKPLTPETSSWETTPFKTVIVIGGQHENTVKLMGLDPHYLYKIVEGGWSWSYDLDHVEDYEGTTLTGEITSDKLITNPFIFVNSKKNTKVRHAESAVYNDFRTAGKVTGVDAVGETQKKQETSSESTETK